MSISVRFRLRPSAHRHQTATIQCRLRVNGQVATDFSTKIAVKIGEFCVKTQKIKGRSREVFQKNETLQLVKDDLYEVYQTLRKENQPCTAARVRDLYLQKDTVPITRLMQLYELYIETNPKFLKPATIRGYKYKARVVASYIQKNYKGKTDMHLYDLNDAFGHGFQRYLLTEQKVQNNTMVRYMKQLEEVLTFGLHSGYIERLPFSPAVRWKRETIEYKICYIEGHEIEAIANHVGFEARLQAVADLFVFQCWTGLNYADLLAFNPQTDISEAFGRKVIRKGRAKNAIGYIVPLFEQAQKILDKYNGQLPPIIANQKMNEYLKEIGRRCGIATSLSTKVGRASVATHLLNNGVDLLSVSRILGHKSIETTKKHYAHLHDKTLINAFENIR